MTVMVTVEFPVQPDKLDGFLDIMREALADTRAFEGCIKVETFVEADSANVLLVEEWAEVENQHAYLGWRGETGFTDVVGPFMAGAPIFRTFDIHGDV